jgi:arsenical pump membrane protein
MPPLPIWLTRYLAASIASIVATYFALRWTQREALSQKIADHIVLPELTRAGKTAACGIAATALLLLAASAFDFQLGLPTAIAGAVTAALVLVLERKGPWDAVKDISWGVLPLVAGLFVLVEALDRTGLIGAIAAFLHDAAQRSAPSAAWGAGLAIALASNLVNNLPAGLVGAKAIQGAHVPESVTRAILIGVDIGPNLSVTGSLATILWLTALRREGLHVGAWTFLKLGVLVTPPALLLALGASLAFG